MSAHKFGIKNGRCRDTLKRLVRRFGFVPESEVEGYKRRIEMLGREQKRMRDPERTLVCDIIANGQLLPDPSGRRYPPNSVIGRNMKTRKKYDKEKIGRIIWKIIAWGIWLPGYIFWAINGGNL